MSAQALPFGADPPGLDYARHPYPLLAQLRDIAPRYHVPGRNAWFFSAHADIAALLRDDRMGITQASSFSDQSDAFRATVARRLRAWFGSSGALLEQTVSAVIRDCLADVGKQGGGDLVPAVAHAVPLRVMASLLGIPVHDLAPLQRVAENLLQTYDLDWAGRPAPAAPAPHVLGLYFQQHWRSAPSTPLMEMLRAAAAEFDLPPASMVDTCSKLFTAGTTTTAACIANILARLVETPDNAGNRQSPWSVEDLLRLDAPILAIKRVARSEVALGDSVIHPGEKAYLLIGTANRPSVDDRAGPSLTFGLGRYHCLGAALARLEIAALVEAFRPLAPQIRLAGPVQWREAWLLHEARSLPVKLQWRN
jgi:unspecific monooxygenase